MTVAWGILSTARINREVLAAARESDAVDVIAVASRDGARAGTYARERGIERAYGTYEDLLADADVEAVYNPLPNSLHVPWSLRALEAGKHVLCEKPLSRRPDDVGEAFDLAERSGLVLMEAFMYRHHPQTRRVAELVREGAIGRLRVLRAAFGFLLTDPADIRMRPDLDGGSLMDVGCYCVSGARLLGGEPERVYGEQTLGETGVDIAFHGILRFPNELVAQFDASFATPGRQTLEAVGEDGVLLLEAPWRPDWGGDVVLRRDGTDERVDVPEANAYRLELENVSAAIRGDGKPLLARDDALGQARAIEALYRSAEEGRPIDLAR